MLFNTIFLAELWSKKAQEENGLFEYPFLTKDSNELLSEYARLFNTHKRLLDVIYFLDGYLLDITKQYNESGTFFYKEIMKKQLMGLTDRINLNRNRLDVKKIQIELLNEEQHLYETFYAELRKGSGLRSEHCFNEFRFFYEKALKTLKDCEKYIREFGCIYPTVEIDVDLNKDFFKREDSFYELLLKSDEMKIIPNLSDMLSTIALAERMEGYYKDFTDFVNNKRFILNPKEFRFKIKEAVDDIVMFTSNNCGESKNDENVTRNRIENIFDVMYKHFSVDKEIFRKLGEKSEDFYELPNGTSLSSLVAVSKNPKDGILEQYIVLLASILNDSLAKLPLFEKKEDASSYALAIATALVYSFYLEVLWIVLEHKGFEDTIRKIKELFSIISLGLREKASKITSGDLFNYFNSL